MPRTARAARMLVVGCVLAAALPATAIGAPVAAPQTMAAGLAVPWDVLAVDGRTLITERSSRRIRAVEASGTLRSAPVWTETSANKVLGMDRHPGYASNRWVYVYVTYSTGSKVLRLIDDGTNLRTDRVIFDRPIATDGNHDGGRIRFGPDGKLYVTTGDIHNPALPRDLSKLNGKILRLNDDGSAPADNPFAARSDDGRFVWSSGHRHPQGLAWDSTGRMWASEHGPSGEAHAPAGETTGNDEVNLIVAGGDYGWPQSSGAIVTPGTRAPAWVAGSTAVAPGGLVFAPDGRLYVPMLAGMHLRVFEPRGDTLIDSGQLYAGVRLRAASMLGCTLAFTTDKRSGSTDEVRRVEITPCTAPVPTPGSTTGPVAGTTDPVVPVIKDPAVPVGVEAAQQVLGRAERLLKRLGLRGIATRSRFTLPISGLSPGTLAVGVRLLPRRGRPLAVAAGRLTIVSGSMATMRLRTTRAGRKALKRSRNARLRVTMVIQPTGGAKSTTRRTFTVRRAGIAKP